MHVLRKGLICAAAVLLATAFAAPPADAGYAIRLEKEVLTSAVGGASPLAVRLYASRAAASPVAAQNFRRPQLIVSMVRSVSGAPMYRVRLDFTNTTALTRGMDLWWELWAGGSRLGIREPVPQSAWALFAVDADTVDGLDAADFAPEGHGHAMIPHDHDERYYTETELATSGAAGVHWDNILAAPDVLAGIYRRSVGGGQDFVPCDADTDKVLGGGGSCPGDGFFIASYPDTVAGVDRWVVECQDALGAPANATAVYAVCLAP